MFGWLQKIFGSDSNEPDEFTENKPRKSDDATPAFIFTNANHTNEVDSSSSNSSDGGGSEGGGGGGGGD